MSKIEFLLSRINGKLWVWPALMSLAMVGWVWVSYMAGTVLEPTVFSSIEISRETLLNLFTILASTMLTVATFSVSAIASAYASVATTASPRATRIVMQDGNVRSTLSAFLAAFIYAVVAITALSAAEFGVTGRFLLFLAFVVQVGWVLLSFLSWVDRVSRLGRLGDTVTRVAAAGRIAFENAEICGTFSARRLDPGDELPDEAHAVRAEQFGYVQHMDLDIIQGLAEEHGVDIRLRIRPGVLLTAGLPMAHVVERPENADDPEIEPWDEHADERLLNAVTSGPERSIETDPRFALILLAEIADRALSPGVNDPGTAIAVLPHQMKLLHEWVQRHNEAEAEEAACRYSRVWVPGIESKDLIFDAFAPIARDGAGMVEVVIRLLKALEALTYLDHKALAKAAADYSKVVVEVSEQALCAKSEKEAIRKVGDQILAR